MNNLDKMGFCKTGIPLPPFFLEDWVLLYSLVWPKIYCPPVSTSQVVGITGKFYYAHRVSHFYRFKPEPIF